MARTGVIDSATAQFFINLVNNASLNHRNETDGFGYAVFGEVIDGMDVVDGIARTRTHAYGTYSNVPMKTVTIKNMSIIE